MFFSSASNEAFDLITRIASRSLSAPISLISVVSDGRQRFKSAVGLAEPWNTQRETPLSHSFCQHVISAGAPLVIDDARAHPLVRDNPAIDAMGVAAYAGVPLQRATGEILGALCAIDRQVRAWRDEEVQILVDLASSVVRELEWRKEREDAIRAEGAEKLRLSERRLRALITASAEIIWTVAPNGRLEGEQPGWAAFTGQSEAQYSGFGWMDAVHPDDRAHTAEVWLAAVARGDEFRSEYRARRHDGVYRLFQVRAVAVRGADGEVVEWVGMNVDITDSRRAEDERRLLADASRLFASSIDFQATLSAVSRVAVSSVADWCGVDIVEDGVLRRVANAHRDPSKAALAEELLAFLARRTATMGIARVARERETVLLEAGHPTLAPGGGRDAEETALFERLGLTSAILVPLLHDGQTFGVLSLARTGMGPDYTEADLPVARELGARAASALANARLLRETEDARMQLQEQTVELEQQLEELQTQASLLEEGQAEQELLNTELKESERSLRVQVTERVRAEAAARAGEERMRAKLEASPIPTYLWRGIGDDVVLEDYNEAAREFSPTIARAVGRTAGELYGEQSMVTQDLRSCLDERRLVRRVDFSHHTLDGQDRILVATYAFVLPDTVMVHVEDVTEVTRMTESLRAAEERYRSVFEGASEGFFLVECADDGDFRYLDLNPAMERIGGRPREEFIGRRPEDLMLPESAARVRAIFERVLATGESLEIEHTVSLPRGPLLTRTRFHALRDESGRIRRILASVEDVTERKRAEDALLERQRWVRALFDNAPDGMAVYTMEGKILDVNARFCDMHGYTREELLGQDITTAGICNDADELRSVWESLEPGVVVSLSSVASGRDGREIPIEVALSRILHAGQPVVFALLRDVTDRTRLQDQLRQASKMEAVGRLSGGVAHDFNNMLQSILGHTEMALEAAPAGSTVREDLEEVRRSANRAADLTRQLLAFSRQQVLESRPLSLTQSVLDIQRMLTRMLGEDIDFVTKLQPGAGQVMADPTQIEQVMLNLAVNARDAMPDGGVLVVEVRDATLSAADLLEFGFVGTAGSYVLLEVGDSGAGMDAETQEHIFEPFFTTKGVGKGTGLGLAMVYGIVTQSGGHVRVDSAPGHGTRFQIFLPRLAETQSRGDQAAQATPRPATGSEAVLIVEDQEAVRRLAARILRRVGYEVFEARDGVDALRFLRAHVGRLDLLLTDAIMPQMGGRELAIEARRNRPSLRVLCMSGYTDDVAQRGAGGQDEMPFIQKPFTPDELAQKVRDVLDREMRDKG